MKSLFAFLPVFVFLASQSAMATDRNLNCVIGRDQGSAQIQISDVEGHPELKVFDVVVKAKLARTTEQGAAGAKVQLRGLLSASLDSNQRIQATGEMSSDLSGEVIINPQSITLQGYERADGSYFFSMVDSDRILQLGYGVSVDCH